MADNTPIDGYDAWQTKEFQAFCIKCLGFDPHDPEVYPNPLGIRINMHMDEYVTYAVTEQAVPNKDTTTSHWHWGKMEQEHNEVKPPPELQNGKLSVTSTFQTNKFFRKTWDDTEKEVLDNGKSCNEEQPTEGYKYPPML